MLSEEFLHGPTWRQVVKRVETNPDGDQYVTFTDHFCLFFPPEGEIEFRFKPGDRLQFWGKGIEHPIERWAVNGGPIVVTASRVVDW